MLVIGLNVGMEKIKCKINETEDKIPGVSFAFLWAFSKSDMTLARPSLFQGKWNSSQYKKTNTNHNIPPTKHPVIA